MAQFRGFGQESVKVDLTNMNASPPTQLIFTFIQFEIMMSYLSFIAAVVMGLYDLPSQFMSLEHDKLPSTSEPFSFLHNTFKACDRVEEYKPEFCRCSSIFFVEILPVPSIPIAMNASSRLMLHVSV